MTEVVADEHGRITIPKEMRERFGDRYRVVQLQNGIKLLPIPDDPVAALRDAASEEFREASMDELLQAARGEAENHSEGAGLWKDIAISEHQFAEGEGVSSDEVKRRYGLGNE